jgi:hypothetical protein
MLVSRLLEINIAKLKFGQDIKASSSGKEQRFGCNPWLYTVPKRLVLLHQQFQHREIPTLLQEHIFGSGECLEGAESGCDSWWYLVPEILVHQHQQCFYGRSSNSIKSERGTGEEGVPVQSSLPWPQGGELSVKSLRKNARRRHSTKFSAATFCRTAGGLGAFCEAADTNGAAKIKIGMVKLLVMVFMAFSMLSSQ